MIYISIESKVIQLKLKLIPFILKKYIDLFYILRYNFILSFGVRFDPLHRITMARDLGDELAQMHSVLKRVKIIIYSLSLLFKYACMKCEYLGIHICICVCCMS